MPTTTEHVSDLDWKEVHECIADYRDFIKDGVLAEDCLLRKVSTDYAVKCNYPESYVMVFLQQVIASILLRYYIFINDDLEA